MDNRFKYILFLVISLFIYSNNVYAKEGYISCQDASIGLNLRDNVNGNVVNWVACGNTLDVVDTNSGSTSGVCDKWYKINYKNEEYFACGDYITLKEELTEEEITDYRKYLKDKGFPDSYIEGLVSLHEKHPKWKFEVFNADIEFGSMVEIENNKNGRSLLWDSNGSFDGYKSLESWSYDYLTNIFNRNYSGGGANWYAASFNTIAYYMDPRNFFNEKQIFMFETLGYNSKIHLKNGVEAMLKGTFMDGKLADTENNISYADAFMDSAKKNNVSPYVLISRVIQEVGAQGSTIVSGTVSGYEGYYNFYNIGATGEQSQIIINGLKHAKAMGWDSPYKAIVGGASFLSDDYIDEGQDTLYLQKWDLFGPLFGRHQYQQNIQAPSTESIKAYSGYNNTGLLDSEIVFSIPVFKNNSIPTSTKLDNPGNPNNYLKSLKVNDIYLFESATHDVSFDLEFDEDVTSVNISATKVSSKSSISGIGSVSLTGEKQSILVTVVAENGSSRDYVINIKRNLTPVNPDPAPDPKPEPEPEPEPEPTPEPVLEKEISEILNLLEIKHNDNYIYGFDVNTNIDSIVKKISEAYNYVSASGVDKDNNVKSNKIIFSGDKIVIKTTKEEKTYTIVIRGDVNGDGKISAVDYVFIKNHIMNTNKLSSDGLIFADVNKDGKVSAVDYVLIKNHIMNTNKITQ